MGERPKIDDGDVIKGSPELASLTLSACLAILTPSVVTMSELWRLGGLHLQGAFP